MFLLQLRDELWKLFGKKRTYIGFITFVLAQNLIIMLYRFTDVSRHVSRLLENNGFDPASYLSALTFGTIMVVSIAYSLLPLYAALVGGDLVAKEAEDGTLRMIFARPISRVKLALVKFCAGAVFSVALVASLGVFGLLFGSLWFPWGKLFAMPPFLPFATLEPVRGLECYAWMHLCMIPKACTIMALGFMFSCFNMKPAAATVLGLSVLFVSNIMQDLPFFIDYRTWFITYHLDIWRETMAQRIPWWRIGESFSFLLAYNLSFLVIGCTVFHTRDLKS